MGRGSTSDNLEEFLERNKDIFKKLLEEKREAVKAELFDSKRHYHEQPEFQFQEYLRDHFTEIIPGCLLDFAAEAHEKGQYQLARLYLELDRLC